MRDPDPEHSNLTELHAWHSNLFFLGTVTLKPHWAALKPFFFGTVTLKPSLSCMRHLPACACLHAWSDQELHASLTCMCMPDLTREAVAPLVGDRALSLLGWATGPYRPLVGLQAPCFFYTRNLVANLKNKKLHLGSVAPIGRPGVVLKYFKTDIYFWNFDFF